MHSMLRGHVSVRVCVRMCACIFLYRMCFLLLAWRWAPASWLARCPLWCHGALSAGMRKPLCFPACDCSCLRALASFPLWVKLVFLLSVPLKPVHHGFKHCLTSVESWSSFTPRVFREKRRGMFSLEKGFDGLIALCSSSATQRSTFSSLVTFSTFFRHFSQ